MITIHQRHRRTDRRTDGQTTCDRNTALCTKVHRSVKTEQHNVTKLKKVQHTKLLVVSDMSMPLHHVTVWHTF